MPLSLTEDFYLQSLFRPQRFPFLPGLIIPGPVQPDKQNIALTPNNQIVSVFIYRHFLFKSTLKNEYGGTLNDTTLLLITALTSDTLHSLL